ncbi:lysylphosphatidylglycerol synthase transmembrane domain-containing protein [Catalinimonas sp. 4WD22]|uniref:lysylphosphatidylglycerol synthase transmembrane domain-containing protein n=1 Tax=Catalinimonas locisalis TaxID=3133978 RepID=UPI0031011BB9
MDINSKKIFKTLNPNKIWIPVVIGLGIVFYMFYSDPDLTADKLKLIFEASVLPIVLAFLVIFARDAGYVYRIKTLTNHELSWNSSIYVIIFWEFASAVTPSIVGGTSVVVFILVKEGISLGKSLAYVMLTAILDNLFFVLVAPVALLFTAQELFPDASEMEVKLGNSLQVLFVISYVLITIYTFFMFYAIFIRPRGFKWLLLKVTSISFLRRWRHAAGTHGDEIIIASELLRGKKFSYWAKIIIATFLIWSARYLMLNCLIAAFTNVTPIEHLLIFCRHLMMWITMLISPTPGSSGTAEFFFAQFFTEFLGDYTFVTNILWRMLSYYPYLILGAIFLPKWIRRVFFKKKSSKVTQQ